MSADDALAEVARRLGREVRVSEPDGTEDELIAGAIHPEHGWLAWVVGRERELPRGVMECSYRLQARTGAEDLAVDWEVETYNPYFGCDPLHLAWYGEHVVFIYSEKHRTYAASVLGRAVQRVALGGEWSLEGGVLICGQERYLLPSLGPA